MAEQNSPPAPTVPSGPAGGQQVQVKITDDILKGVYSNQAMITHTNNEFVLDFMNIVQTNGIVTSRVIVSPAHMKALVLAMQDNLKKFEDQFGTIKAGEATSPQVGFRTE